VAAAEDPVETISSASVDREGEERHSSRQRRGKGGRLSRQQPGDMGSGSSSPHQNASKGGEWYFRREAVTSCAV
jgi:hypothetical protein